MDYSKVKQVCHLHIYQVYKNRDAEFHIDKFPVIYMNSEFCYIKCGRKQSLVAILTPNINVKLDINNPVCGYYLDAALTAIDIEELKKSFRRKQLEKNLIDAKQRQERAKMDYERYEQWVRDYGEQLKALGEESYK